MAGLGDTVTSILKQQSSWRKNFPSGLDESAPSQVRGTGILEEIVDIEPNPGNLRMLRYVPRDAEKRPPLVVVLHGCTQQAAAYAEGAGWVELADRYGFCLLMPEQRRSNNPNLCFNWFLAGDTTRDSGEVQSIHSMVMRTVADCGIDPARVFVTGLSAGGAMTSAMLATYPEVFAGGAIVAGLPYQSATDIPGAFQAMAEARIMPASGWAGLVRSASEHQGPWPKVSIWHGDADKTVHPGNAAEIAKQWTELHGSGQQPALVEPHESYTRRVWNNAAGEPAVEEYIVPGLGHGTPLATGNGDEHFGTAAPFLLEAGLSSSYRIATFWGIAQGEPRRHPTNRVTVTPSIAAARGPRRETPMRPATASAPQPDHWAQDAARRPNARAARYDIGSIINRALKSAGLIN